MPIYCFVCKKCGNYTEQQRSMADSSRPQVCDCGEEMSRSYDTERPQHRPGNWPMCSDAAGVNPDQRLDAMKHAQSIGIPTEFNAKGQAVFTSASHRKRYCEAIGMYDRNGGYSDPQRK